MAPESRWDANLIRRVAYLRVASSIAMGFAAVLLPAFGGNRLWLAMILWVGSPTTTLITLRFVHRDRVQVTATLLDSCWVAVAVIGFPVAFKEASLVALAMMAFVAVEDRRYLLFTAGITASALLTAGLVHAPPNWVPHVTIFMLLLPLMWFMAQTQHEREVRHQRRMRHRIEHDVLTGLPNRTGLARTIETETIFAIVAIDLDGFKDINDTLGHAAGDELLRVLADRLVTVIGHRGVLARVGGDEFAIATFVDDPARLASDVLRACRRRIALGDVDVSIGASIGIAEAEERVDGQELLRRADLAMYEAKRNQAGIRRWTGATRSASRNRVELSGEVEEAFERGEFELWFQPIVDAGSGRLVDAEGLLRWNHPRLGMLSPGEFLELVEGIGRRSMMDRLVFAQATALAARLPADVGVSVNVSAGSLLRSSVPAALSAALEQSGVAPSRVTVEVIEDEMIDEVSTARSVVEALGAMGVGVAIDDFGTGHSSLSRLRRLPVTSLKIDRAFVSGTPDSEDDRAIVRAVCQLGRALGLTIVAEGVENDDIRKALVASDLGVHRLQGWGIAPAMRADDLVEWYAASVETENPTRVVP